MSREFVAKAIKNLGIEIDGVSLTQHDLQPQNIRVLLDLFDEHHLLVIKNQDLSEKQLIAVAHIFGEPVQALVPTYRLKDYPLITQHTNLKDRSNLPLGVVAPEFVFHADSYFTQNPTKTTLFYCLKAPKSGGHTNFVNMCTAYESLDNETKIIIRDKTVSYKNAYINQPPVSHPLVRCHPIRKQKALYVNKHRALSVSDMELNEGLALVNELYTHATSDHIVYKHEWSDGDLLIWNNVTTMHCATPISDSEERLLYRILTKGEIPVT